MCRTLTGSDAVNSSYYHGKDGFGDAPDPDAPDLSHIQSEHAVLALIRLANQYPGRRVQHFITLAVERQVGLAEASIARDVVVEMIPPLFPACTRPNALPSQTDGQTDGQTDTGIVYS